MTSAALLAGVAAMCLVVGLADLVVVLAASRARGGSPGGGGAAAASGSRWGPSLVALGRRVGVPAAPGDLGARLAAAGMPSTVTAADAMAAKAGGGVVAALGVVPAGTALPARAALMVLPAAAIAGFLLPDLWLARRAKRRAAKAEIELADVLDLLRVAVEAGLPIGRALEEVGRRRGGLVAAELRRVAAHLELGVARAEALRVLHRRLPLPAVAVLVAAVRRADRHGTPLGPALDALAHETRSVRARALHAQAAAAAPRIQLAIALLLVPAVLLFVAAGLVHGLA